MYQALVQSILLYGAEAWTLNRQQANKLLATEMDFWRSARISRKEKVRNVTIREVMEVGKNTLEVIEEKRLRWFDNNPMNSLYEFILFKLDLFYILRLFIPVMDLLNVK
jgi:hypothetical protein